MTDGPLPDDKTGDELSRQRFAMLEDIARELAGEVVFPTCFNIMLQLRTVLNDPAASSGAICEILVGEPLVCSKLLGIANSAAYNPRGAEIVDIRKAVPLLGLNLVRSVAMATVLKQLLLSRGLADFDAVMQQLWEHSILAASASQVIARRLSRIDPAEAFLAGLVHDIGVYYMLYRSIQYDELRRRPETLKHLVMQWHESIGETLLAALGLPEGIIAAVREHDHPRPVPAAPGSLADIVYVANIMAGGIMEWLMKDIDSANRRRAELGDDYLSLLPEIEALGSEVRAAFGN